MFLSNGQFDLYLFIFTESANHDFGFSWLKDQKTNNKIKNCTLVLLQMIDFIYTSKSRNNNKLKNFELFLTLSTISNFFFEIPL